MVRPYIEGLLEPGEQLDGVCAAVQQSAFSGRTVALATTDRRLIVQGLSRRTEPEGETVSISPGEVAALDVRGVGDEWWNTETPVVDASVTMRLKTTSGQKLKLQMMRGGEGLLGRLGGGEAQQQGVAAVARWMRQNQLGR